jgi:hypothetical protein
MGCSGIDFQTPGVDFLPALEAFTIVPVLDTPESMIEGAQFFPVAAPERQLHLLLLHRIHPRQAADSTLIKLHRKGIGTVCRAEECMPPFDNTPAKGFVVAHVMFNLERWHPPGTDLNGITSVL